MRTATPGGLRVPLDTNNPLVVNEMKLGEVSLAVVEHGKVVLPTSSTSRASHSSSH